jgi:hypothetical protein
MGQLPKKPPLLYKLPLLPYILTLCCLPTTLEVP